MRLAFALITSLLSTAALARPVTLDRKDAPVQRVLRHIAAAGNVNLVVADGVKGRVTVRFVAVPWRQALRVVSDAVGAQVVPIGDAVVVRPR